MYQRLLFSSLFFILSIKTFAQIEYGNELDNKHFFYGIELGVGYVNYDIKPSYSAILSDANEVDFSSSLSAKMNGIIGVPLTDFMQISFTPGVLYTSGTITWKYLDTSQSIKNYFLTLPINIKIHGKRMVNIRPMIEFGISYSKLLNSREKSLDDNSMGVFRMKSNNFIANISVGIDIYTPYIKISPSISYLRGLNNICVSDHALDSKWTNPIKNMYLSGLFFCIRFQ